MSGMFPSGVISKFRSFMSRRVVAGSEDDGDATENGGSGPIRIEEGAPGLVRCLVPPLAPEQWACQPCAPESEVGLMPSSWREAGGDRPSPRSGHVAVMIGDAYIYLYGGYNKPSTLFQEMWRFHILSETWEKVDIRGFIPMTTCSQSAVAVGANRILVFGGTAVPFGERNSNQLVQFTISDGTWRPLSKIADGEPAPSRRFGQAMVCDGRSVWVVGGTDGHEFYADVWRFDLEMLTWEPCHLGARSVDDDNPSVPYGRYRHEALLFGADILVIGGGWPNVPAGTVLDEIHAFSTVENTWQRVQCKPDENAGFPLARRSHTCTLVGTSIFLLGGANSLNAPFPSGEVWALETKEWQWRHLPTEWPVPSYFHTTVSSRDGRLYTFGGVNSVLEMAGGERNERHNRVCCFNALKGVPSLSELATQAVATYFGRRGPLLAELGVPRHLLTRLIP
eukprot:m.8971 g.8971  ORF g.8971 m.8971 type:complete len:451 (-) comp4125_c0_seq1:808-2160(-)